MSTPPYYQNTPPQKSNSNGCWKAAGIGCGVIILLGVIGTVVAVQRFKQMMNDPKNKGLMGSIMGPVSTVQDGMKIRQAIISYHDKSGKYPVKLTDLIPAYLTSKAILHSKTDANPDPQHVSWTYTRPAAGADPKTPILKSSMTMQMGDQKSSSNIIINLDGSETSGSSTQYGGTGSTGQFSTNGSYTP